MALSQVQAPACVVTFNLPHCTESGTFELLLTPQLGPSFQSLPSMLDCAPWSLQLYSFTFYEISELDGLE
jgi:hypothetical protein